MSEQGKSKAILETAGGISQEFDHDVNDIPESSNYTVGYLKDTAYSFYIVFEHPYYNRDYAETRYVILDRCSQKVPFGFVARSIRCFNNDGIALFEYRYFGAEAHEFKESCSDITPYFPCMQQGEGISSVIIKAGEWYLLTKDDGKIPAPGRDDYVFAEGNSYDKLGVGNDKVYKVQKI